MYYMYIYIYIYVYVPQNVVTYSSTVASDWLRYPGSWFPPFAGGSRRVLGRLLRIRRGVGKGGPALDGGGPGAKQAMMRWWDVSDRYSGDYILCYHVLLRLRISLYFMMCLKELDGVLTTSTCNYIYMYANYLYLNARSGKSESRNTFIVRITFRDGVATTYKHMYYIYICVCVYFCSLFTILIPQIFSGPPMMGPSNKIPILLGFWWDGNGSSMEHQAVKQMDLEVRALPPEARQKLQETPWSPLESGAK